MMTRLGTLDADCSMMPLLLTRQSLLHLCGALVATMKFVRAKELTCTKSLPERMAMSSGSAINTDGTLPIWAAYSSAALPPELSPAWRCNQNYSISKKNAGEQAQQSCCKLQAKVVMLCNQYSPKSPAAYLPGKELMNRTAAAMSLTCMHGEAPALSIKLASIRYTASASNSKASLLTVDSHPGPTSKPQLSPRPAMSTAIELTLCSRASLCCIWGLGHHSLCIVAAEKRITTPREPVSLKLPTSHVQSAF